MPDLVVPGSFVEELPAGIPPILGVPTSVAGFLGPTDRGPEAIQRISSWHDYQRWYGRHLPPDQSFMAHAVQGFFQNGGQSCYIGRITGLGAARAAQLFSPLKIFAHGSGAWGNRIFVRIVHASLSTDWVRVQVLYFQVPPPVDPPIDPLDDLQLMNPNRRQPNVVEDYDNLSVESDSPRNLVQAINQRSQLIRVEWELGVVITTPTVMTEFKSLVGGADGNALVATDYAGSSGENPSDDPSGIKSGLLGLNSIDEVALIVAPDEVTVPGLTQQLINSCEQRRDRIAILSTKTDYNSGPIEFDSDFAAIYHPWIQVFDPELHTEVFVPASGHISGVIARTDLQQGVHKAPANAEVVGATNLQRALTKQDQDVLNPLGINCIRDFRNTGRGILVWGARTLSHNPEWRYLNVRRLFLFLEKSILEGTQWVVFEPNAPNTWAKLRQSVASFLTASWRDGALVGTTRDEAFFVRCDSTTMTQDDINQGRIVCYIGVALIKTTEFIVFRIEQKTQSH